MSIMSEIRALKREIKECEADLSDLESKGERIRRLQSNIKNEAEMPAKTYDMTSCDEFRGILENKAEDTQYRIYSETVSAQNLTSKLLLEIERAKERIRERIRECEERIEHLEAELEALSNNNERE